MQSIVQTRILRRTKGCLIVSPPHMNLQVENFQRCKRDASPVCQLLYCAAMLFRTPYCKIKRFLVFLCVFIFNVCSICVRSFITLLQYSTIADYVRGAPRLTLQGL